MKKIFFTAIALFCISIISFAQYRVIVPEIVSPNDAATQQMPDAVLSWHAVINGTGYHVILGTDENLTNVIKDTITEESAYRCLQLDFNSTYFWKVLAMEGENTSDWTEIRSFTTFEKLDLTLPTNGQENRPVQLPIKWKANFVPGGPTLSGFDFYQLQIDTMPLTQNPFRNPGETLFENPIWNKYIAIGNTQWLLTDAYFGKTFHWRIRAIHSKDTSAWSDTWTFTTKSTIELKNPNNNLQNAGVSLILEWNNFVGVGQFVCEINTNPSFNISQTYFLDSLKLLPGKFNYGTTYYWRVLGRHLRDTTAWSEVRNFTTAASVNLASPANGADSVSVNPVFAWHRIFGSAQYQVLYSKDQSFSTVNSLFIPAIDSIAVPSFKILSDLQNDTEYFWKVRGLTPTDTSEYSEAWSFKTIGLVGINEHFSSQTVRVYPNPASSQATLQINAVEPGSAIYSITDLTGQEIQSDRIMLTAGVNNVALHFANMAKGIYLVNVKNENQHYTTKIIIK